MSQSSSSASSGISFGGALTILFIGLKLGHAIDWSWLWVLSPFWISVALFVAFAVIFVICDVIVGFSRELRRRQ